MLTPIPRRILRDSVVFHVPTGVDRYQTPTTEDVTIECVHIQADNSVRKTPNNTEVTLRATLFVDARYSKPHVDLWGLQEAAQAAGSVLTCTVTTKYGPIKTDYMLFIAAGAFHVSKVTDLIPELQGRFPVHVQLKSLSKSDFMQIMTVPENALTKQYKALLEVDKVLLQFEESAISAIAEAACNANENGEDIGARRLHAIFEQLLEDVLFNAGDEDMPPFELRIDDQYVNERLKGENRPVDIHKYIL